MIGTIVRGAAQRRNSLLARLLRPFARSGAALALAMVGLLALPAPAQAPKAFDWYEDAADLGFKIKVPKEWKFIPPQPGDRNLIGKYDTKVAGQFIYIPSRGNWGYHVWLVKFDRRKTKENDAAKDEQRIQVPAYADIPAFLKAGGVDLGGNWKKVDRLSGPLNVPGVAATESVYEQTLDGVAVRVYVAQYKLSDDLDVALIANGPGDDKKWGKFDGPFATMGKSFKRLELESAAVSSAKAGDSPVRARKRAEMEAQIRSQPGWSLYETPNYFIVSNNPDKAFIDELMARLEAIRKSYEETYPPAMVVELKKLRDAALAKKKAENPEPESGEGGGGEPKDDGDVEPQDGRSRVAQDDPIELSRCSVVRVVENSSQYQSYGGPPRSAGYWSSYHKELVIYDDKAVGGRNDTWATMNHEAFHQYIYYFFGNLAPHSWYNEGTGDFYAGYQLKNGRFELKPFNWRVDTIKAALRERSGGKQTYIPLKELVRYTQAEYYGNNKHGIEGGANYAQGWSFVWFLRTGPKNARGWNKAWTPILDTYLKVLVETDDLDQAVDQAFAGVDWDELEKAWIDYTLAI